MTSVHYNIVSNSKWLETMYTLIGDTNIVALFGCIINLIVIKKEFFVLLQSNFQYMLINDKKE